MEIFLATILAYFIGSINGAIIASHLFKLSDPRALGSKNPGATNMLRVHGKIPAITALLIDYSKALTTMLLVPENAIILSAAALCLGHIFPVYHKFKGGKGVAVTAGVISALSLKLMLVVLASWLITYSVTKISSVAATVAVLFCLATQLIPITSTTNHYALIIPCLAILASHKSNYQRLLQKTES